MNDKNKQNLLSVDEALDILLQGAQPVHAVEDVMDNALKTHFHEMHEPQHALQNLADALPAPAARPASAALARSRR